jgi:hypothetical protein
LIAREKLTKKKTRAPPAAADSVKPTSKLWVVGNTMVLVSSSEDGERETITTRDSSSSSTLNRLIAIANFLKLHQPLWRAHVVEFFQEKLWEKVDPRWLACLQAATVKDWLLLPSGIAQVYIHLYGSLFCLSFCLSFAFFLFVKA